MPQSVICIGSRKSELARIQAYSVGEKLLAYNSKLQIKYKFSSSFGDRNLDIELDETLEKGLFTKDLKESLEKKEVDLVVHSWKDLPIEETKYTEVIATLKRADSRDLLLVKKDSISRIKKSLSLKVLSSSPRRTYELQVNAKNLFPWKLKDLNFSPIRGNIPTRLKKFIANKDADAFILAKAGLDRLLLSKKKEFFVTQDEVKGYLTQCEIIILPLRWFPSAPAQGALAIEILKGNQDLKSLLEKINCEQTFEAVQKERDILREFGGGCHQKIGVSYLKRSYGDLQIIKASLDSGEVKDEFLFFPKNKMPESKGKKDCWPVDHTIFSKRITKKLNLDEKNKIENSHIFLARPEALPEDLNPKHLVWTSGLRSWRKLTEKGILVHGSFESLGEIEKKDLSHLFSEEINWIKLTHSEALQFTSSHFKDCSIATYDIDTENTSPEKFLGKTHFYWTSASQFLRVKNICPEILSQIHSCGPGNTFKEVQKFISSDKLFIWDSYSSWLKEVCK